MTAMSKIHDQVHGEEIKEGIEVILSDLKAGRLLVTEGFEVILAEMAKWHAALAAVHEDVREIKKDLRDLRNVQLAEFCQTHGVKFPE